MPTSIAADNAFPREQAPGPDQADELSADTDTDSATIEYPENPAVDLYVLEDNDSWCCLNETSTLSSNTASLSSWLTGMGLFLSQKRKHDLALCLCVLWTQKMRVKKYSMWNMMCYKPHLHEPFVSVRAKDVPATAVWVVLLSVA